MCQLLRAVQAQAVESGGGAEWRPLAPLSSRVGMKEEYQPSAEEGEEQEGSSFPEHSPCKNRQEAAHGNGAKFFKKTIEEEPSKQSNANHKGVLGRKIHVLAFYGTQKQSKEKQRCVPSL